MTQPPHWQPSEYSPQASVQYGPQPPYGQPQYGQQPQYEQPTYAQPPFYGPGPYPPPPPPKRSNRAVILSIVGVLVIAGGAVAAIILLTGSGNKHAAGLAGVHRNGTPVPGTPTAFPKTNAVQGRTITAMSCSRIRNALTRGGGFTAGSITVSDGGTPPSTGVPRPSGTPTATCTIRPSDPSSTGSIDHIVVIAWRGVSEHAFAARLKGAGYAESSKDNYTVWFGPRSSQPDVVTTTMANQLVTFYPV